MAKTESKDKGKEQNSKSMLNLFYALVAAFIAIKGLYLLTHPTQFSNDPIILLYLLFDSSFVTLMITTAYVYFTFLMFAEMRIQRIQLQRPMMIAKMEPLGTNLTILNISNQGGGSAFDIELDYTLKKGSEIIKHGVWKHTLLKSSEFEDIVLSDSLDYLKFLKQHDSFEVHFSYNSYFGEQIKDTRILNFKELAESAENNLWLLKTTTKDDIHSISDTLKEIKKELNNISAYLKKSK